MNGIAYGAVALAAAFWAANATLAKHLFSLEASPLFLTQCRTGFGALALALILGTLKPKLLSVGRREAFGLAVLGIVFALNQFLYFETISRLKVAPAILLEFTGPTFIVLYGALISRKLPTRTTILSLIGTLLGCALLLEVTGRTFANAQLVGIMTGLGSAVAFAWYSLHVESASERHSSWTLLFYALMFGALASFVVSPHTAGQAAQLDAGEWGAVLYISVFGTVLPFGLYLFGIAKPSATHASITATLQPVIAAALSYIFLAEHLGPVALVGGALVIASVTALQLARSWKLPHGETLNQPA